MSEIMIPVDPNHASTTYIWEKLNHIFNHLYNVDFYLRVFQFSFMLTNGWLCTWHSL